MARFALVFLTGCVGVILVDDPESMDVVVDPPTPPDTETTAWLDVAPSFRAFDGSLAGCELNPQGELWIELFEADGSGGVQVLVQDCAAQVSFEIDPMTDARATFSTLEPGVDPADPRPQAPPREPPDLTWFASDLLDLGPVAAGSVVELAPVLACQANCPVTGTWLVVHPTFYDEFLAGGCELNPTGELWLEAEPFEDLYPAYTAVMPCSEPTSFELPAWVDGPWQVQVRSVDLAGQFDPVIQPYYASAWNTVWFMPDALNELEVDLACVDVWGTGCAEP